MSRVVVLGGTGMLGGMVADVLAREQDLDVLATARDRIGERRNLVPSCAWDTYDAERSSAADLDHVLKGADWAINAIGLIKPYIRDTDSAQVESAMRINGLFPHLLAKSAERAGCRVIQIATDCVYSGSRGSYVESDSHDPLDVYGKTKSLGEVVHPSVVQLRCSLVGPEERGHLSLLDWFRRQPANATVQGYKNHRWNGVTTLAFGRLCLGVMRRNGAPRIHVIPSDPITKADLLVVMRDAYRRSDIKIIPALTPVGIDRSLATEFPDENAALWAAAGYPEIPTIKELIREMAVHRGWPGGAA